MNIKAGKIIAVISDDVLRALLEDAFKRYIVGDVVFYKTGQAALEDIQEMQDHIQAGVVLLFDSLPDMDTEAFHGEVRKGTRALPLMIVFPSAEVGNIDIPKNDVFHWPLRMGTFLDRIEKHRRQEQLSWSGVKICIGPYRLMPEEGLLVGDGDHCTVRLTEKERDILLKLYQQKGEIIDRRELLDDVWGYVEGMETHTLETHIYRLRQKLEEDPAKPLYLVTDGMGYKLAV